MDLKLSKVKAQIIKYVEESQDDTLLNSILDDLQESAEGNSAEVTEEQWKQWVDDGVQSAQNEPILTTEQLLTRHANRRGKSA